MKKRNVIVSSNYNPIYVQFVPLVCSIWRKWGYNIHLVLITDKDESEWVWLREYANVIHENTRSDIDEGIWSKVARILHYVDFGDEITMLSDIDMIPLGKWYFDALFEEAEKNPTKMLLSSYDAYISEKQFNSKHNLFKTPGCYMLTSSNTWNDIINPDKLERDQLLENWKPLNVYDNKESILKYHEQYRQDNKEVIAEKQSQLVYCKCCNSKITYSHISRHNNTLTHIINLIQY